MIPRDDKIYEDLINELGNVDNHYVYLKSGSFGERTVTAMREVQGLRPKCDGRAIFVDRLPLLALVCPAAGTKRIGPK